MNVLLYGAASFLYELFPNGNRGYAPDLETISSFFGTSQDDEGNWVFNNNEQIPANWTNRVTPYSNITGEILAQYLMYPVLFGGRTAQGAFELLSWGGRVENGSLTTTDLVSSTCMLYQLGSGTVPLSLSTVITPTIEAVEFVLTKVLPILEDLGCPIPPD